MSNRIRSKNPLKILLALAAFLTFAASCIQQAQRITPTITSSERPDAIAPRISKSTFERFSHKIAEHKQFECNSCHRREGRSLDMEFAAHESCIGCHLNQFTTEEPAMCAVCHKDLKPVPPTMNDFPVKFREGFNMKFDHADHDSGAGRPPDGCASCHSPAGAGRSIPAGFRAHAECYACHTPDTKIGSCSTCHELAPYSRTSPGRTAFRGSFSHGDHSGTSCGDCHEVRSRAPQGRQVTNIAVSQHCGGSNNCSTCHNGSRAFGDGNFADLTSCARCHAGAGFDMLAGDPCRK